MTARMNTEETGRLGEDAAARYLLRQGYTLIDRNFRCRLGEIDIIAREGDCLVFAEVKTRKNSRYAEAREYVTYGKQQRILRAAKYWLMLHPEDVQVRFDVLEVYTDTNTINLIRDAF